MEIDNLLSYQEILTSLEKKKRKKHLLFGNGFSMAYDPKIFSYNALSNFIETAGDPIIRQLFQKLNTKNFELIMQQLDTFCEIANVFSTDKTLVPKIKEASEKLKNSLIDAVRSLHPEHVFKISTEKSRSCLEFLKEYLDNDGLIFSTNYDLLLYWVLMRNATQNSVDGFGRYLETELDSRAYVDSNDLEFSDLIWGKHKKHQTIHYLHGTLPIFDNGIDIIKVQYDDEHFLLQNVSKRIDKKEYPIFVTSGNGHEKLNHIMHNKYLSYCYEKLCTVGGSLITFGFNFGDSDTHIIDAINKAHKQSAGNRLWSVYIGVYSDQDLKHINEIQNTFKCKVVLYNARTVNIWDA